MERTDTTTPLFSELTHYAGFDWGIQAHEIAVVDREGQVLLKISFEDTAAGWAHVREKLSAFGQLGVAVETRCGPAVERLLEAGLIVFPLNPKAAERYRDRKAPSGVKNDALDARCFADALRTDGHGWRTLLPQDPLTQELRMLCRDEIGLIEQRTALVNRLREALHEYYPVALQVFDDWTLPSAWSFVLTFPTPQELAAAGQRKWQKFLHANKLYRAHTADRRMKLFACAGEFVNPNAAVTRAKSFLAVALARQLRVLQIQLDNYRAQIRKLFQEHPDHDIFGSLPGAGEKIAPRLLAECGDNRAEFDSPQALQCYAGTAPVSSQSGKKLRVRMRHACNHRLRHTIHLWADESRRYCAWAQAYYQQKKGQGMNHASALRCLGNRWLKILWRIWQDRVGYDEGLHMRNQVAHGSWVLALMPEPAQ
jgi:transposase